MAQCLLFLSHPPTALLPLLRLASKEQAASGGSAGITGSELGSTGGLGGSGRVCKAQPRCLSAAKEINFQQKKKGQEGVVVGENTRL